MINVTGDAAKSVIDSLKSTPFLLALVLINVIALLGFGYILHEVSDAMERREGLIKSCIERKSMGPEPLSYASTWQVPPSLNGGC